MIRLERRRNQLREYLRNPLCEEASICMYCTECDCMFNTSCSDRPNPRKDDCVRAFDRMCNDNADLGW